MTDSEQPQGVDFQHTAALSDLYERLTKEAADYEDKQMKVTFACITIVGGVLAFVFGKGDSDTAAFLTPKVVQFLGAVVITLAAFLATFLSYAYTAACYYRWEQAEFALKAAIRGYSPASVDRKTKEKKAEADKRRGKHKIIRGMHRFVENLKLYVWVNLLVLLLGLSLIWLTRDGLWEFLAKVTA